MNVSSAQLGLLTLCALAHDGQRLDWSLIAREALAAGGVTAMAAGQFRETSPSARTARAVLPSLVRDRARAEQRVLDEIALADGVGARLVTVIDDGYPSNLKLIPNLPPFLFVRGSITAGDARSVAVVGTRQASEEGLARAGRLARELADRDVTVVSGLAAGIDTAAHQAALTAGGRTVAVIGTGITGCYPAANRGLADRIADGGGAVVSQFWPSTPPARHTFPRRNVVTSGISQGTVVIEASSTSGAKMQARLAIEHGKRVFLLRSLVTGQSWARRYVDERGAVEVTDTNDVLVWVADADRINQVVTARGQQLALM